MPFCKSFQAVSKTSLSSSSPVAGRFPHFAELLPSDAILGTQRLQVVIELELPVCRHVARFELKRLDLSVELVQLRLASLDIGVKKIHPGLPRQIRGPPLRESKFNTATKGAAAIIPAVPGDVLAGRGSLGGRRPLNLMGFLLHFLREFRRLLLSRVGCPANIVFHFVRVDLQVDVDPVGNRLSMFGNAEPAAIEAESTRQADEQDNHQPDMRSPDRDHFIIRDHRKSLLFRRAA